MAITPTSTKSKAYQALGIDEIANDIETAFTAINNLEANPSTGYTETIVTISSAQILAMGTTPIELLPAPGAGKYYDIEKIVLEYTHVSTSYTLNGKIPCVKDGQNYGTITFNGGMFNEGVNTYAILKGDFITNVNADPNGKVVNYYNIENNNLVLTTFDAGEFTLGDGTLRVKIYHKTITFGA